MTLEELKTEAKRQGYNLIPIPKPKPKMLPCPVCGRERRDYRYGLDISTISVKDPEVGWSKSHYHDFGICHHCGFEGPHLIDVNPRRTKEDLAVQAWNEYITKGETYWDEHPEQKPD